MMITNNFTPYSGGVVSSINALVYALQQAGHEVIVVTLSFLKEHNDPVWVKRLYCPIKFRYRTNHMAIAWRPKSQIKKLMQEFKPDVVHMHHPFMLGRAGSACAKLYNIPTLFTYHTIYQAYAHYIPLPQWLMQKMIIARVMSFCRTVDAIISPSLQVQEFISKHVRLPIVQIPSGLQPDFVRPYISKQRAQAIKLLLVSRMVKEKNVTCVLDVAQMLCAQGIPFELKLIGYGDLYQQLCDYAYGTLKLSPHKVVFVHKPPKQIISQAYQQADLFLFPSSTDTQGLVLAEAMAHATPVLALDGPGQRDIIKQGINGYIVNDAHQMCSYVQTLHQNRELLSVLEKGAYSTAQGYLPDAIAHRYIAAYEQVIKIKR